MRGGQQLHKRLTTFTHLAGTDMKTASNSSFLRTSHPATDCDSSTDTHSATGTQHVSLVSRTCMVVSWKAWCAGCPHHQDVQGSCAEELQPLLQADFFGLPGLADKASGGLDSDTARAQSEGAGPSHAASSGIQYDSVYLETGFHPVKSEFDVLQQRQTATMEVCVCVC